VDNHQNGQKPATFSDFSRIAEEYAKVGLFFQAGIDRKSADRKRGNLFLSLASGGDRLTFLVQWANVRAPPTN
jgi:hypothetical protein